MAGQVNASGSDQCAAVIREILYPTSSVKPSDRQESPVKGGNNQASPLRYFQGLLSFFSPRPPERPRDLEDNVTEEEWLQFWHEYKSTNRHCNAIEFRQKVKNLVAQYEFCLESLRQATDPKVDPRFNSSIQEIVDKVGTLSTQHKFSLEAKTELFRGLSRTFIEFSKCVSAIESVREINFEEPTPTTHQFKTPIVRWMTNSAERARYVATIQEFSNRLLNCIDQMGDLIRSLNPVEQVVGGELHNSSTILTEELDSALLVSLIKVEEYKVIFDEYYEPVVVGLADRYLNGGQLAQVYQLLQEAMAAINKKRSELDYIPHFERPVVGMMGD